GVVLHHERWLPAIDAAPRLGLTARAQRDAALVIKRGTGRFVLLADAILGIQAWDEDSDIIATDAGLVTPILPETLFQNELGLAAEGEPEMNASTTATVVVFRMDSDEFGTDISQVIEVLEYRPPVRLPRLPQFLEGVIYVRDEMLPVIDLRKRMELPAAEPTP